MRVQITKMPLDKAAYGKQVDGSLSLKPGAFGGADYTARDKTFYKGTKDTIGAVSREDANLEAEGGETAFGPISGQSIPDHLKIVGKRHSAGGVPLNLPDDTFIFSDTASLKIKDPSVLAMFNKSPKKGGYTPAELAKPYNINKYKSILLDPDTGKLERDTATIMIKNFIMKLGALALVQESMKGFPQGIPEMAKPYMEANGIKEEDLMPELKAQADALAQQQQGMAPQMPQEQNPMAAQEMQQMDPQQAMQADQAMMQQGEQGYPQQMPSGAPVASPEMMEQMAGQGAMPPPEMMQEPGMMAYGGVPYGAYGMEMGGYDFPYNPNEMAYGGLFKAQDGVEQQNYQTTARTKGNIDYNTPEQTKQSQFQGANYNTVWVPKVEAAFADPKKAEDLVNRLENYAGQDADDVKNKLRGKTMAEKISIAKRLATDNKVGPYHYVINDLLTPKEEAVPVKEKVDDGTYTNVEKLSCKCKNPVTGEVTSYPIEKEGDCVCPDGGMGQVMNVPPRLQTPHWSIPAKRNIMANAMMAVNPAPVNVAFPGNKAQVQGAYDEYQTKVDTALAANAQMQNAIMNGTAGAAGTKQAMMKDILGKSLRAGMEAVDTTTRSNTDRQTANNIQNATIDNAYSLATAQALQGAFNGQKQNRDLRTVNVNRRRFGKAAAMSDADKEMVLKQQMGVTTPQYGSEYDQGFIYATGVEKPFSGGAGSSLDDRIQHYLAKTGDYAKAFDMAYKEARISSKYGGQRMDNGGYVFATNAFPFIL